MASRPGWRWPLAGRPTVVRPFDPPQTRYGAGHRGVDLAGPVGAPVLAAGAGVVRYAGTLASRGVVSILHQDGLRTTYEPVRSLVRQGQLVRAGQQLGVLVAGHPGCLQPACLHWGLLRGTTYLNPLLLLARGPVRLLPVAVGTTGGDSHPSLPETSGETTVDAGSAGITDAGRSAGSPSDDPDQASETRLASRRSPVSPVVRTMAVGLAMIWCAALLRRRPP